MNMKLKRSERRHHLARMKKKYRRNFSWLYLSDARSIGITARTPKRCSCFMCGNPRKYFKVKTIQEQKSDQCLRLIDKADEENGKFEQFKT